MAQFFIAEVETNQISFKESEDKKTGEAYPYGCIKIKYLSSNKSISILPAYPLDPYDISIPIVGEYVLVINLIDKNADPFLRSKKLYYGRTINFFDKLNENKLIGLQDVSPPSDNSLSKGIQSTDTATTITDNTEISKLQSYEGDKILLSRHGSAIRFSSNNIKNRNGIEYQNKNAPWKGNDTLNPILMLTNGYEKSENNFLIEKPDEDKSLIYLTSDQQIKINSSQQKLGAGITESGVKNYNESQVIISADRLFLNARKDHILLSSKKSVNIATPRWQMNMNEFFTLFEDFLKEVMKTAQASSPYATGVGPTGPNPGLQAGLTKIQSALTRMKQ